MAHSRRSRRTLASIAAAVTAAALLAGCGGSAVTEATDASAPLAAGPETGAAAAPQTEAGPQAAAAAAGAAAAGPASPVGKGGAAGVPAGGQAGTIKAGTTTKSRAAAATGGSAVEKMIASAPIFGGTATCKPATLSEVSIGNVSTLSGVLGELFGPVRPALETFVASQNACGGLNGHKIKFFIEDDQGDPSTASSKVQGLIQTNKVLAFVGNIQPLTVDAIVPVIKKFSIPVIGSDITNNTWFSNPLMFPQGPPGQSISYGFLKATTDYFKKKAFGHTWCIEVPRACEQIDRAAKEMAPQLGVDFKKSIQVSITAPSYVQQCLDLKNAGVEVLAMSFDAATMNRMARSCQQVGFTPNITPYPLGVGNEKQYFGNKWLGNAYIPLNTFPWMGNSTGPEKYWQAAVTKYNPGFASGGSASLGWSAGALLVAASAGLSETNPTTQQFLDTLFQFKGQEFTKLGGLAPGPLTFREGSTPKVPYCLFAAITNAANTGWATPVSKSSCTDILAPSDPQKSS